ncbi:MAG: S9 family peptidase [Caulobacterales bacterium]
MRALRLLLAVGLVFASSASIADAKRPVKQPAAKAKQATPPTPRIAPNKEMTDTLPEDAAATPVYGAAPVLPTNRRQENQLIFDGIPVAPASMKAKLTQYSSIRSASFMDFLPSGGVLISTRFGDAAQVHRVDMPLGDRKQLTFFADPVSAARVRPNGGGQFVYTKDLGGDEFHQLYLYDPITGTPTQLTEPQTRNEAPVFSHDGLRVVWSRATASDPNFDLMWMDLTVPNSRRVILEGQGALEPLDFSPDGRYLLYGRYESVAKSRRFLLDLSSGAPTELTPTLNVSYDGGEFTPDGQSIILISDEASSFARLVRLDLKSQKRTALSPADIKWDVESFDLSPDGKTLAYVVNAGGSSELRFVDIRSGKALSGIALPPGLVLNPRFDATGARLGFSLNAGNSPSDAYIYDLKDAKLTRWTESEPGGLNPATFVTPALTAYPTFDNAGAQRRMIPAFVYKPRVTGRAPVILFLHGGPEAQFRPSFSGTIQYWVNELGFAVVAPNVRGSTGYGREYVSLDNGMKREDSVKDVGAALDWIAAQPDLDPSRVVVYGGSYGGYMAYAAMTNYNARLAGGVSVVGISNWVSFLENTKGYRRDLRRVEYGDERDPNTRAFMQTISPLSRAASITKPLLVVQGANDPRVPMSEAEQMVARVRSNGGEAWYLLGLDEGHGFQKKQNQEAQRAVEAMFLNKVAQRR